MHTFTISKQVLFAMNRPNVLCSPLFAPSETLTKGMYIVEVTKGPLAGPPSQLLYGQRACPRMDLFVTSHPSAWRLSSMAWLSTDNLHTQAPTQKA